MARKATRLVRYVSPFGSPAWMTREQAQKHLDIDDRRWCWLQRMEQDGGEKVLSDREKEIGPPRIEYGGVQ